MNKIPKPELIKIAVAGHTNTGKTTMIQTLMKQEIGEIDDRANVTKDVKRATYEYEGLQALFIDTPGFQEANTLFYMQQGLMKLNSVLEKKLEYEMKAWEAIKSSDVILYVVSLETVPDGSHQAEIELVVSAKKGVVALFNKGISKFQVTTESDVVAERTTRIEQWKEVLCNAGLSKNFIFEFDAHWYDPDRVEEIYSAIKECLPNDKSSLFGKSLLAFQQHQQNKVKTACHLIFQCLDKCRQTITVQTSEFDYNQEKSREEVVLQMSQLLNDAITDFINNASELYYEVAVPSNVDNAVIKNPQPNTRRKTNIRELLIYTGSTTGGLAALGTTLGVAIGAFASAILTGGGVGILLGAQVGSVIGTCLGGVWGVVENAQTDISAQLSREELGKIQCTCVMVIWALSQHGFGVGKEVDESLMARRYEIVQEVCSATNFDWLSADEKNIIDQCTNNLSELNKIPLTQIANT
ncbi:MAG: hypothetical protein F6K48_16420 [Okeania sp. SIO3H1]|nr:hypothetical protein [Okeania sp. SIO3H1]